jgi:hypothetical protein
VCELFIEAFRVENGSLIVHERVEVPAVLVAGVDGDGAVAVLHDDAVVLLLQVDLVLVVPLAELEVALALEGRLDLPLALLLNQPSQTPDRRLHLLVLHAVALQRLSVDARVKVGLVDRQVNLSQLVCESLVFLGQELGIELGLEVFEDALAEFVIAGVLREL